MKCLDVRAGRCTRTAISKAQIGWLKDRENTTPDSREKNEPFSPFLVRSAPPADARRRRTTCTTSRPNLPPTPPCPHHYALTRTVPAPTPTSRAPFNLLRRPPTPTTLEGDAGDRRSRQSSPSSSTPINHLFRLGPPEHFSTCSETRPQPHTTQPQFPHTHSRHQGQGLDVGHEWPYDWSARFMKFALRYSHK